ncbi:hypothetical protein CRI93_11100 [Longimonas halophila]|uniref:Uncharacterized protein n=1 Tax=Longimonas halophila TaxID=1469170 RepID=A0A2H3NJP0_9BACT|nr:hypothetical protein CRI93_11100 [Longimonas halophila]
MLAKYYTMRDTVEHSTDQAEIQTFSVRRERLRPEEFITLAQEKAEVIRSSTFVPPQLDDNHFGYVEVEYERPQFRPKQIS